MIELTPLQRLSNAIVIQAAKDYRIAIEKGDDYALLELERFFRSPWFYLLTNADGEYIMEQLRRRAKE